MPACQHEPIAAREGSAALVVAMARHTELVQDADPEPLPRLN
jgi:hypothetical protein